MGVCFSCGGPLRLIGPGLYRCRVCRQLNEERGGQLLPRRMEVYPRIEQVREAAVEGQYEMVAAVPSESGLHPDMIKFVRKVSEILTPLKGYEDDRGFVARALKVRNQFKQELTDVFEGRKKFQEWYDSTRTSLGMRDDQMDRVIYDALEGLRSPEAVEMRMMFEDKIRGGVLGV